ncbi:MAG: hypothetical protein PF485_06985 [Bacteroidales bacterium]|jgi:hypothetical protein|nr:hypothetical protein [Bacteroidales bacterium]
MKTRPNNKIIFYWILALTLIGLLFFYIENKPILYITSSFIVLTLIFNRVSYLKLKADSLLIAQTSFLIFPTFKFLINTNDIINLSLIDYKDIRINDSRKYAEFEAVVVIEIITGTLFYKPNYKLVIDLTQNKRVEFDINSRKKDVLKIIGDLQKQIN